MLVAKRKSANLDAPIWFDGTNINEALFCDEFLSSRKIIFANDAFFTPDGSSCQNYFTVFKTFNWYRNSSRC